MRYSEAVNRQNTRIVTDEEDIAWFLQVVDNLHDGLTFCARSLSAGMYNDTRELARKFAGMADLDLCFSVNVVE